MVNHVVILAGGSGTRLWPASVKARPKQFMEAQGSVSFLGKTLERAFYLGVSGKIVVVAHKDHAPGMEKEFLKLSPEQRKKMVLLSEPEARNTAPALMLAVQWALENPSDPAEDDTLLVLPADHLITPPEAFKADVEKADVLARKGYLVPFGIPPTRPETGYGYLQGGDACAPGRLVKKFKEKPDMETAKAFLAAGDHYWNSGMFVYGAKTFLEELTQGTPEIPEAFRHLKVNPHMRETQGFQQLARPEEIASIYGGAPSISVDYGVMEKSRRVAMVDTSFTWNDVGSWDEMSALDEPADQLIYREGSKNCYVNSEMPVALCGVEDLIVVVQNGSVLVCRKGESQRVKEVVTRLKEEGRKDLL